ncbi:MAG: His-Xaa-Ser system radical SAM maturase HxsB [Candidatus Woesearchaeota archaeon]
MSKEDKEYRLNNFRSEKIGDKVLVTTEHGEWTFLNEKEYNKLLDENVKDNFELFEDKGIIVTPKNKEEVIEKTRKKYSFLYEGTSLHIIIPTLRCNQKCIYCHASSKPLSCKEFDMDKKTAKRTVDFIFQSPSENIAIEFQGGEPLIKYDLIKYIIKYAKKKNEKYNKNLDFVIVTNFAYIDEEKLDYFEKEGVDICTSLDGPKKLHEYNRNEGTYDRVAEWIDKVNEIEEMGGAHAVPTITKESLKYPKKIVDEYVKRNLEEIHLRFLNNLGNARENWEKISYSPEEFIKFWKEAVDYIIKVNKEGNYLQEKSCHVILKKLFGDDPRYLDLQSPCGAVIGQLVYNYNGDIYTCDEGRMVEDDIFKLGNVSENDYKEITTCDKSCNVIASSINDTTICDSCAFKPYCGLCPVCNFAEQGNILGKVPSSSRCKILKYQFEYIFSKLLDDGDAKEVFMSWLS